MFMNLSVVFNSFSEFTVYNPALPKSIKFPQKSDGKNLMLIEGKIPLKSKTVRLIVFIIAMCFIVTKQIFLEA